MSAAKAKPETEQTEAEPAKKSGKRKLVLLALPVVLILAGAGLWFTGILPSVLGLQKKPAQMEAEKKPDPPTYVELPETVVNLDSGNPHRPSYLKLDSRIEVPKPADADKVHAAMPRIQDIMQTYLREMRPEELRGSAGTYRLREELLARINTAVAPVKVSDILFTQMLMQ